MPRYFLLPLAILLVWPRAGLGDWQTFNVSSGLASNYVFSITEDRAGNLWFGTYGGLSRFNGVTWTTHTEGYGVVLGDQAGNIWTGTSSGAARFDGIRWTNYPLSSPFSSVTSILQDHSGNLWFGTFDGGVYQYDGGMWRRFTTADGLASDYVTTIIEDHSGRLWFGTQGGGVSRFDGAGWATFTTADGLVSNYISSIVEDNSGNMWFGAAYTTSENGLSRYDGNNWRVFTPADGLVNNFVISMLKDRAGNLWFGTLAGISRFDGSRWTTYTTADGLVDNRVNAIFEDSRGNLWFGSGAPTQGGSVIGGGLSRFDGATSRIYDTRDGLVSNGVTSALEDHEGAIWFGTDSGVSRFDGVGWRSYTTADGLVRDPINTMLEDRSGTLWFGTSDGISRFDRAVWTTYTTADGLVNNNVISSLEDRSGNLWFGTSYGGGVNRFDGVTWNTYTTRDGLADNFVSAILEDHLGNLWFSGFGSTVSRFDGTAWRRYTTGSGQVADGVFSMLEDRSGNLWFGRDGDGVVRFDGTSWRSFTTADGLADNHVRTMALDHEGRIWLGTDYGASRFDGASWRTYTTAEGLAGNLVTSILEDRYGSMWFGTRGGGVSRNEMDRVSPRTVFLNVPARTSSARNLSATFIAAFGEAKGIEYSYRFDGGSWSVWAPVGAWTATGLPDGPHLLEARSRDYSGNVDPFPALASFTVDATPPAPSLSSPAFGQVVQGTVSIRGTTADSRLLVDSVWVRPAGTNSWMPPLATLLGTSSSQVTDGVLATWDTSRLPDASYEIRISALDSLGLAGTDFVTVVTDNNFPFVNVTAPAKVTSTGGDIYTANQELHLYFPPHAFVEDAVVSIALASAAPDTLETGALRVLPAYEISWSTALRKAATLEFSTRGATSAPGMLAVYSSSDGIAWERIGGTPEKGTVVSVVTRAGRYALFAEGGPQVGGGSVTSLAFTPRVFSSTGTFANPSVAISFTLGRPAPVTVRVYSRSGRLVREIASGLMMNAGANLVRWDGRDREGRIATDGIYLVTVEALGRTERSTLAVVK